MPTPRRLAHLHLTFSERVDRAVNARIHALARGLLEAGIPGITDLIPGYTTLLVEYDPATLTKARLRRLVGEHLEAVAEEARSGRRVSVEVVYDGPDLQTLASAVGLSPDEVARRHAGTEYLVYAVGFTPGFPFLGDVDPAIRMPRLGKPRASVPAGSVGIADGQTGIYPLASPGGWRLVGRALTNVYDPYRERPFLLEPGDLVSFVPTAARDQPPAPTALELLPPEPRFPALRVQRPGLMDLVVDEGRFLAGRFGLARSGPLDPVSARIANGLLANEPNAPLVEINVLGPDLEVLRDVVIAVAGPGVTPRVDGAPLETYTAVLVKRGQLLTFPPAAQGRRSYLAVAGGIESREFLGSASVDTRGKIGRPLEAGDVLGARVPKSSRRGFGFTPHWRAGATVELRLLPGPQHDLQVVLALTERPLRIEHSDRMGVRLSASAVQGGGVSSEGNPLGAVQLTGDGHPLILLNDRGTMGGYTKPAIVDPRDLPKLAQARDGAWVRFVVGA